MDIYTQKTQAWLDQRFAEYTKAGIYKAHQPIYGFRKGPAEGGCQIEMYIRTWHILNLLKVLDFNSLVDIGGAEGFKSFLIQKLLGKKSLSCDLSQAACDKATELFGIESKAIDVHTLDFEDNAFDLVLCSEVLEHVTHPDIALKELLRVAKKAVLITVPHESIEQVKAQVASGEPHAHIHHFNLNSFDHLKEKGYQVYTFPMVSPQLKYLRILMEAMPRKKGNKMPQFVIDTYNKATPILSSFFSQKWIEKCLKWDSKICDKNENYQALMALILPPDNSEFKGYNLNSITPKMMLDTHLPVTMSFSHGCQMI